MRYTCGKQSVITGGLIEGNAFGGLPRRRAGIEGMLAEAVGRGGEVVFKPAGRVEIAAVAVVPPGMISFPISLS